MGDPAGIGPDITLMAWRDRRGRNLPPFVLYADPAVLSNRASQLALDVAIETVDSPAAGCAVFDRALPVIACVAAGTVTAGRPDVGAATAILSAIDRAVAAVQAGTASAVVTNPIAKSVLYQAGFHHPGHTEYLAVLATGAHNAVPPRPVMMLVGDDLRVVPVTIHIPLSAVPSALTAELITETLEITRRALQTDFGIAIPRIAVAGLNPHAGEGGGIGREEIDLIVPVIQGLRAQGVDVSGPFPADTLFHAAARVGYDAAVCMYHDQALIPIKTLAFDRGVNMTLGLPFVRTSPDHGTAFAIAGSGTASAESLIQALRLADHTARLRAGDRR